MEIALLIDLDAVPDLSGHVHVAHVPVVPRHEDRGLLHAGQDLDVVGHPAYLLPTPRQYLSSEHKSDSITFKLPPILAGIISAIIYHEVKHKRQMKQMLKHKNFIKLLQFL